MKEKIYKVNAIRGIEALSLHSDSLLVIDNDKLLRNLGAGISIINAFRACDDVLYHAVQGITDFIVNTGFINVDFNDVITVMKGRGYAMIGTGYGKGANCTKDVVESAICSPLIDRIALSSAAGVLANLRISYNFSLQLIDEICSQLQEYANDDADCKFGFTYDDKLEPDEAFLTVLITGVDLQGSGNFQQIKSLNKNNIGNQNQQNRTEPVNLYPQSSMFNQNGSKPQLNAYQMLQSRQVGFGKDTSYENNAPYNNNMRGQSTRIILVTLKSVNVILLLMKDLMLQLKEIKGRIMVIKCKIQVLIILPIIISLSITNILKGICTIIVMARS